MAQGAGVNKPELVTDVKAILAEGPCWDADKQLLYWVDIIGKKVHIYDPESKTDKSVSVPGRVGTVVPRKSGGFVIAMENGFYFMDEKAGSLTLIAQAESGLPQNRFNDGKCDPAGRFWAGTMNTEERKGTGSLYCMGADLQARKVFGDVKVSNGITWSPDFKTMYYIDSPTREVAAFDFDTDTGNISNKRVVVRIPEGGGVPDGMTSDVEGMLWVAQWDGWQVSRWNPNTGELLQTVPIPAARVSSCVFGGPNLDELYITTARHRLDDARLAEQPLAGEVF